MQQLSDLKVTIFGFEINIATLLKVLGFIIAGLALALVIMALFDKSNTKTIISAVVALIALAAALGVVTL